jgi:hypothetical protein
VENRQNSKKAKRKWQNRVKAKKMRSKANPSEQVFKKVSE